MDDSNKVGANFTLGNSHSANMSHNDTNRNSKHNLTALDMEAIDFSLREFNKNRKIIIKNVPPCTYDVSIEDNIKTINFLLRIELINKLLYFMFHTNKDQALQVGYVDVYV